MSGKGSVGVVIERIREWISLDREVLALSGALLMFSLVMQMTGRFGLKNRADFG